MVFLFLTVLAWSPDASSLDQVNAGLQKVYDAAIMADGNVNYEKIKNDKEIAGLLDQYLDYLAQVDLDAITDKNEKIALLSNAYNAITLAGVAKAWPVTSVRKISPLFGFFKRTKWGFAGGRATLDTIENKHLRPLDNRIHFIINCASASCPPLYPKVLTSANVEAIMEKTTHTFLSDPSKNIFDKKTKTYNVSKIFKWFQDDWKDEAGVVAFVRKYRTDLNWEPKSVKYLDYDWALNGPTGK